MSNARLEGSHQHPAHCPPSPGAPTCAQAAPPARGMPPPAKHPTETATAQEGRNEDRGSPATEATRGVDTGKRLGESKTSLSGRIGPDSGLVWSGLVWSTSLSMPECPTSPTSPCPGTSPCGQGLLWQPVTVVTTPPDNNHGHEFRTKTPQLQLLR